MNYETSLVCVNTVEVNSSRFEILSVLLFQYCIKSIDRGNKEVNPKVFSFIPTSVET